MQETEHQKYRSFNDLTLKERFRLLMAGTYERPTMEDMKGWLSLEGEETIPPETIQNLFSEWDTAHDPQSEWNGPQSATSLATFAELGVKPTEASDRISNVAFSKIEW